MSNDQRERSRRQLLRFLLQSPLLYGIGGALTAREIAAQEDAVLSGALELDRT